MLKFLLRILKQLNIWRTIMQYKHNKIILLFTTIFIIIELILIYSTSIVSSNLGYNIIILSNLIPFISMMFLKSKK